MIRRRSVRSVVLQQSDSNITTIAVQFGTLKRSVRFLVALSFFFGGKCAVAFGFWCPTLSLSSSTWSAWIFDYPQYFRNIELITFDSVCSRDTLKRMLTNCWLSELQSPTDTTSTACNSHWNKRDAKLNTNCCPLSIVCELWVCFFVVRFGNGLSGAPVGCCVMRFFIRWTNRRKSR